MEMRNRMRNGDAARLCARVQRGFGYLLVLFAVAALGMLLAGAGQVWHTAVQREKEAELLFIGNQFRQAIGSYYEQAPDAVKQYPVKLEDLVEDRRFVVPRRHLRKLYRDPMTGHYDWELVKTGDRIVGVHSRSGGLALRMVFDPRDAGLEGTGRYDEWIFSYVPGKASGSP